MTLRWAYSAAGVSASKQQICDVWPDAARMNGKLDDAIGEVYGSHR